MFKPQSHQLTKCLNFLNLNLLQNENLKNIWYSSGSWVAQSVKGLTSARVMISEFVSSNLASSSALTDQSLEPASDSVSPCLFAPPPHSLSLSLSLCLSVSLSLCLSVSLSELNIKKKIWYSGCSRKPPGVPYLDSGGSYEASVGLDESTIVEA